MLNTLLSGTIARLKASKDDRVHLEEIGDWHGLTGAEVSKVLRKAGLKSKGVRKFGKVARGYMRLDLLELQDKLEREATGQSEAPVRDFFCTQCSEMFEARIGECPHGPEHPVQPVLNKAPGVLGVRTKNKDDVLRGLVSNFNLTDYSNAKDMSKAAMDSMWASPGGAYNVGAALRDIYPNMKNAPDQVINMPGMPGAGKNTITPSGASFEATGAGMIEKSKIRRPTYVDPVFKDTTNVRGLA